jgi:glycosyltransferase involved in cell wall biosynthesis
VPIQFAGFWNQEHLPQVYAATDVLVLPSASETWGLVVNEAMAAGLPVVATKVGIMPDVLEDGRNGVFTTGDPIDLSEKLTALLADAPARARIGTEACRILERFERTDLIGRYALFLKELVSVRG